MAEVNNRPVFKMNNDFWNQPRGPPQSMAQNLSNSNQNSPVPGSTNSVSAHSPSQQSNSSQNHVITQGALALQQAHAAQQAQQAQQAAQQQAQHNQQIQQQQQQQAQNNQPNQSQQPNQQNNPMNQNQNSGNSTTAIWIDDFLKIEFAPNEIIKNSEIIHNGKYT
ncbi:hypothetical protein MML48_9g00000531 [Holotrichia oblita]|uniref:Uncharacterized protein n=1 Tax=Holotrichia oblita TaxID=644536 RepID=A0ACB9SM74_HOLOL|nr:hypothetical protein MML48_9g00000531 [Holotrichia oblita]